MSTPKISIITPSIRPLGLKIVAESIKKQNYNNYEWIICSRNSLKKEIENIIGNLVKYIFIGNLPLKSGQYWDLNCSYNRLFQKAKGELLVSWQDWIWTKPDALQKFWDSYEATGKNSLIATSGNQYEKMGKYCPEICIWNDPRRNLSQGSFYEIYPQDFEWNFGAIPKKLLETVGGFDEKLDMIGYGMDGYQVNERLDLLGYKFYIDHENESFTIRHGREDYGGEDNWNKNNNLSNGGYEKRKKELIQSNNWPIIKNKI